MRFSDWLLTKESSPATRARSAAALGLLPLATVGSLNGHSTAAPWEAALIKKRDKKAKRKKFGARPDKKKVTSINKNLEVDKWVKEVDSLKDDLKMLRTVFDKKKTSKKDPFKPEKPEDKEEKKPKDEPESEPEEKDKKPDSEDGDKKD